MSFLKTLENRVGYSVEFRDKLKLDLGEVIELIGKVSNESEADISERITEMRRIEQEHGGDPRDLANEVVLELYTIFTKGEPAHEDFFHNRAETLPFSLEVQASVMGAIKWFDLQVFDRR